MPIGMRATRGTRPWPPNMKRFLAAWLTISSMPHSAKSTTRISTTGRRPASAMPTPAPRIAASLIGVSITRCVAEARLQSLVLAEDAAAAHVFADHHHVGVGLHFVQQGQRGGLGVGHQRHWPAPVVCTSVKALAASGQASASAAATAAATSSVASRSIASSWLACAPGSAR